LHESLGRQSQCLGGLEVENIDARATTVWFADI